MANKGLFPNNPNDDENKPDQPSEKDEKALRPEDKKTKMLNSQDDEQSQNSSNTTILSGGGVDNDQSSLVLQQGSVPKSFRFLVREGNGVIEKSAQVSLVLGRKNSSLPVDVDLAPYQAIEMGISRQHVKIEPRKTHVVIKDLHSVNGTLLNRFKMKPGHYYDLSHRDELKLGRMHITVEFIYD